MTEKEAFIDGYWRGAKMANQEGRIQAEEAADTLWEKLSGKADRLALVAEWLTLSAITSTGKWQKLWDESKVFNSLTISTQQFEFTIICEPISPSKEETK